MSLRSRILPLVAVAATALAAGPVFAVAQDDEPRRVYLEAEDLLPALESYANQEDAEAQEGTDEQAIARRESVDDVFSGNAGVLFANATEGSRFTLRFEVPEDGAYTIVARFGRGPDHGIVQGAVDGRPLGEAVDLYAPEADRTEELALGRLELAEGSHTVTFTAQGRAQASTGLGARVDYLELRP
jgi:hypothetical protein